MMSESPLTVKDYQEQAAATDQQKDNRRFPIIGLFGEVGSLLSEAKKKTRDARADDAYHDHVLEELGDILWYLNSVASQAELSMSDIAYRIVKGRDGHLKGSPHDLSFENLQGIRNSTFFYPKEISEEALLHFASKVGSLVKIYESNPTKNKDSVISSHLYEILCDIVKIANEAGISLDCAARTNLEKTYDRWPVKRNDLNLFDEEFPKHERFPRKMIIDIFEETIGEKSFVIQRYKDINIGDRLTDNASTEDDYRFHDVFHYAYMAILGWSPVTRALFHMKRKSCSKTDEVEDGARAILIEEGITTWIFNQAQSQNLFKGIQCGNLSFNLLKDIDKFVKGYEVEECPFWLWEKAILQGYKAFRFLKNHRRGRVRINMRRLQLTIEDLPE